MKIAYLTSFGPSDKLAWSGLAHYMKHSLESADLEVEILKSPPFPPILWPARVFTALTQRAGLARRYIWHYDPRVVRHYRRQIEKLLDKSRADVIFSCGTIPIAELTSNRPIAFWTDATFSSLLDYYFPRTDLKPESLRLGYEMEGAAIRKAALGIYSSSWAAESAIHDYQADPARLEIVPFGANLQMEPSDEEVNAWIERRPPKPCRLIFLAVEWLRKEGPVALAVAEELNRRGLRCELTIVGCQPPHGTKLPEWVHLAGFINKNTPKGELRLQQLLSESHFLVLPSRADCTPIVIAEANAYGVPVLTTDTGGIPSVVREGINGYCVPLGPGLAEGMVKRILLLMSDWQNYLALAHSSRQEQIHRLNWKTSGLKIRELLKKL